MREIPIITDRKRATIRKAITTTVARHYKGVFTSDKIVKHLAPYDVKPRSVHSVIDILRSEGQLEVVGTALVKSAAVDSAKKGKSRMNKYKATPRLFEEDRLYREAHRRDE